MKKNVLIVFSVVIFAVIGQLILSNVEVFENLELLSYDIRSRLATDNGLFGNKLEHADKDIVIVAIDNYSMKKLNKSSFKESGHQEWEFGVWKNIVNFIEQGHPKVLMFDMVFEKLSDEPWYNRTFADSLIPYDNIILGTYLDSLIAKDNNFTKKIEVPDNNYLPTSTPLDVKIDNKNLEKNLTYTINSPVNELYTKHNKMGVINSVLDNDSLVRKDQPIFKLVKNNETYYMPSLAFAGFMKYMGEDSPVNIKKNKIYYKDRIIPVDDKGNVNISWHKYGKNYTYIPISKIILNRGRKNDVKPEFFENKIVIIGKTATGANLNLNSIINSSYSGPEINAAALDNYINESKPGDKSAKKFISEIPKPLQFIITVVACIIVAFICLVSKSAFVGCINGLLSIIIYVFFCFWLFVNPNSRVWMPIIIPIYYLALTSGVVFAFRFYREMSKKASIMNTFGKFVSPKVLSTVVKNPEKLALKNTKKKITILFCDIKDFSALCEKYDPEKLVSNLNDLFKEIVNIIFENNGTVDKFIGDCIMAYWGDLADSEDDEFMAVKTALAIKEKVENLKIINAREGKIIFDVKIGINTGEAVLGLTGTDKIMSYTAMGDAVNVASRLESSCTQYQKDILISKSTYEAAKDKIIVLEVGKISVKGKDEQIEVYEPIGLADVPAGEETLN